MTSLSHSACAGNPAGNRSDADIGDGTGERAGSGAAADGHAGERAGKAAALNRQIDASIYALAKAVDAVRAARQSTATGAADDTSAADNTSAPDRKAVA